MNYFIQSSQQHWGGIYVPILQMSKTRFSTVEKLIQNHTAVTWDSGIQIQAYLTIAFHTSPQGCKGDTEIYPLSCAIRLKKIQF